MNVEPLRTAWRAMRTAWRAGDRAPGPLTGTVTRDGDTTTFTGGYGSNVLVLPPGTYTFTLWLASSAAGAAGAHREECSTAISLAPLDSLTFKTDFPAGKARTTFARGGAASRSVGSATRGPRTGSISIEPSRIRRWRGPEIGR
jgi:hypothetical protein